MEANPAASREERVSYSGKSSWPLAYIRDGARWRPGKLRPWGGGRVVEANLQHSQVLLAEEPLTGAVGR